MTELEINAREVLSTLSARAKDLAIYLTPFADIGGDLAAVKAVSGSGEEDVEHSFGELVSRSLAEKGRLLVDRYELIKSLSGEIFVPVYSFYPDPNGDRYRLNSSFKEAIVAQIPEDEDI